MPLGVRENLIAILRAAHAALPTSRDIAALSRDAAAAQARGYFDPAEDERLRETYARYLGIRVSLWDVVQAYKAPARRVRRAPETASESDWGGFAAAFCAASMLSS